MQFNQPTQLGPYTILKRLGRGGMGAVYEATDTASGGLVAVKILASHLADDAGVRKRFHAEIETLKSLRHPGIVQLLAFGEQDGQPYFAMELVHGKSLEQILRSGRTFSWRETVATALTITRALKIAHDHGVVHRDLKPANLLLPEGPIATDTQSSAAGGVYLSNNIKLADFGIAKLFGGRGHTAHGNIVGTAEYMAPEQAAGQPVDHRADLYALGLVMFAMLTGRPPFHGTQMIELLEKQRREVPRRVSSLATVPAELDQLIDRLLAKDPQARPTSALALGRLLTAIEALPDTTPPPLADDPAGDPTASIDLLGQTQDMTPPPPAATSVAARGVAHTQAFSSGSGLSKRREGPTFAGKMATEKAAGEPTRLPTDVSSATTHVDRVPIDRYTTVEELERTSFQQSQAERVRRQRLQIVTAIATAACVVYGGYLLLKPLTATDLFSRILAIAGDDAADLRDAQTSIQLFLARYKNDPRAADIRRLGQTLEIDLLEKRARRRRLGSSLLEPIERDYRAAMACEAQSPTACATLLAAMLALHTPPAQPLQGAAATAGDTVMLWLALAQRQLARIEPLAAQEQAEDLRRTTEILGESRDLAQEAFETTDLARRAACVDRRIKLLQSMIETYASRPHAAQSVSTARQLLKEGH